MGDSLSYLDDLLASFQCQAGRPVKKAYSQILAKLLQSFPEPRVIGPHGACS